MYSNSLPNVTILAQAVLQIFVESIALLYETPKSEKGDNWVKYL